MPELFFTILGTNPSRVKRKVDLKTLHCPILLLTYTEECRKPHYFTVKKQLEKNSKKS